MLMLPEIWPLLKLEAVAVKEHSFEIVAHNHGTRDRVRGELSQISSKRAHFQVRITMLCHYCIMCTGFVTV